MTHEKNEIERKILEHIWSEFYLPVKPRTLSKRLKITDETTRPFKAAIRQLVKQQYIAYGDKHYLFPGPKKPPFGTEALENHHQGNVVKKEAGKTKNTKPLADSVSDSESEPVSDPMLAPADAPQEISTKRSNDKKSKSPLPTNLLEGIYRRKASGNGIVYIENEPGTSPQVKRKEIFVPFERSKSAANGDKVHVRLSRRRASGGRPVGEITKVTQRAKYTFVGTYYPKDEGGVVEVDGSKLGNVIFVADASVKNVLENDRVVVEVTKFPTSFHEGEGVITYVLGAKGEPEVDTLSVIHEYDLPTEFPENVLEYARKQAEEFDPYQLTDRIDFTEVPTLTIDPITARDFDDAISLSRGEHGHWLLKVHIADVAHFVPEGSPLDKEAYLRGTSIYLPDLVIPMLPETLSNNLASLQPDKIRLCKTAELEFTSTGVPVLTTFYNGVIRSDKRFTYEEVDQFLEDRTPWKKELNPEVFELLSNMHELGMLLRQRRMRRGSIELSLPDMKLDFDKDGHVCGAHREINTESHQIIEEFMLAANEAVARRLADEEIPFIRRIHPNPDPIKLKSLAKFARELGYDYESLENRFEIKELLETSIGTPEQQALHFAVLRSMSKAVYSPSDEGHYALASKCYTHFTSPIRRYPDLTIHRQIFQLLTNEKPSHDHEYYARISNHCSEREQIAMVAERELTKLKLLNYLEDRIGQTMTVLITGVEEFGLFAVGEDLPVEGLIPARTLPDDRYYLESEIHTLSGHSQENSFTLGDTLEVTIANVDVTNRQLDFKFLSILQKSSRATTTEEVSDHPKKRRRKTPSRTPRPTKRARNKGKKTVKNSKKRAKKR